MLKKHYLGFLFHYFFMLANFAFLFGSDYSKVNSNLRYLLDDGKYEYAFKTHRSILQKPAASQMLKILVKFTGTRAELIATGVVIRGVIGDIFSVEASIPALRLLAENPKIEYLQGETYLHNLNDVSTYSIKADAVQNSLGLAGRGVIVGIIDTGIDWKHKDFRNSDGTTRIRYLLNLSSTSFEKNSPGIVGENVRGGTVYTESQINQALQTNSEINSRDYVGHGTHVAGTAAGNGLGTGGTVPSGTYAGVAPEADLVIVKASNSNEIGYGTAELVTSLAFIDSIAEISGQPCVINLSLGGQDGAHDGTTLEELAIDELTGPGKPGKVVVVSAGNDRDTPIHTTGTFSSTNNVHRIYVKIPDYTPQEGTQNDYVLFDIWYDGLASVSITVKTPGKKSYGPIYSEGTFGEETSEGTIYIDNCAEGPNALNGDRQIQLQLFDYSTGKPPAQGNWEITLRGIYGDYHLWMFGNEINAEITSQKTQSHLITSPGNAKHAITVGSYVTKKNWKNYYGQTLGYNWTLGELSYFSSPGPSRDGRIKPEISAPGQEIASSYSSFAVPPHAANSVFAPPEGEQPLVFILEDNQHGILHGTSMASPHVTGAVALLFERNPQLDAAQVKEILTSSAAPDAFTGSIPNNDVGYGKLDVLAAVQQIEAILKFPAPYQLKASEIDSGIRLSWQAPVQNLTLTNASISGQYLKQAFPIGAPFQKIEKTNSNSENRLTKKLPKNTGELIGYQIYRSQNAYSDFQLIAKDCIQSEFLDRDVVTGQKYWYYVTAIYQNPGGESAPSNKVNLIRGSETNFPLEISYDNGNPNSYGHLPRGHAVGIKIDLDQDFPKYYLNSVRFYYINYQKTNVTGKTRIKIYLYNVTSSGTIGQKIAESKIYTKNKNDFQPNWTEIDLRYLEVSQQKSQSVLIGVEYLDGDSSTVILDNQTDINKNRAFYFVNGRWEEHYSFWQGAASIGIPMIRAIFTSQPLSYPELSAEENMLFWQNYPNPFNANTTFSFFSPETQRLKVEIFDLLGRKVMTLFDEEVELQDEALKIGWDGKTSDGKILPSGLYLARLKGGRNSIVRKIVLAR